MYALLFSPASIIIKVEICFLGMMDSTLWLSGDIIAAIFIPSSLSNPSRTFHTTMPLAIFHTRKKSF
jgi:hypothetical protein